MDVHKLREYIREQEETEIRLAMECAKTEAVFRMTGCLRRGTARHQNAFMVQLLRQSENTRIDELERAAGRYEFKWELFMAKARLALTSNNNKIGHLEQLVSFIAIEK